MLILQVHCTPPLPLPYTYMNLQKTNTKDIRKINMSGNFIHCSYFICNLTVNYKSRSSKMFQDSKLNQSSYNTDAHPCTYICVCVWIITTKWIFRPVNFSNVILQWLDLYCIALLYRKHLAFGHRGVFKWLNKVENIKQL